MSDGVLVRTNLPQFISDIRFMRRDAAGRIFKSATSAGARVFAKRVRVNAPRRTGKLSRAVYVARSRDRGPTREHYFVGVRRGKSQQFVRRRRGKQNVTVDLDAYYFYFLEKGWRRGGRRFRRQFILPAFNEVGRNALREFTSTMHSNLAKAQREHPAWSPRPRGLR